MVKKSCTEQYRVKEVKAINNVIEIELEKVISISDDVTFF